MRNSDRQLGTMIAYGFERVSVASDMDIAEAIGATTLEVLPDWSRFPDPRPLRSSARDRGLTIHSVHGCWGGRSILAPRVDLGSTDRATWDSSLDDLRRCLDWLDEAGGTFLVVHPGGLSDPEDVAARRDALARGLIALADHVGGGRLVVCVENMPPGVHPGSRMADLADLVAEIDRPEVGLALDTGHANMVATADGETIAAGRWLRTTHVHDNDGKKDTHEPPGLGTIAWEDWVSALDRIGYSGVIMLECIRRLREDARPRGGEPWGVLDRIMGRDRP